MATYAITHLLLPASDELLLPTLLYREGDKKTALAIYVHGAGSSSIVRRPELTNTFAEQFQKCGIDFLAFNNRGAGYITKFDTVNGDTSFTGGMAYEAIADFHLDIAGIIDWAKSEGYDRIYLVGHSTGANKIVFELSHHKHEIVKGVCLIGGGDDIALQRSRYDAAEILQLESEIETAIKEEHGASLVPANLFKGDHPISWRSLRELTTPLSDYDMFPFGRCADGEVALSHISDIEQPILFIYGSNDFGTIIPVSEALALLASTAQTSKTVMIENGDHNLTGKEEQLAQIIAEWTTQLAV